MRIIYLSDYNEKINDSLNLNRFGDDVYCPNLDYINTRNIIKTISNDISDGKINLIIGNAVGAYMAFYISNLIKIPALLFNPTFFYKNGCELKSNYCQDQYIEKNIILSEKHDQIDIKRNFKYLKELGYEDQIKIVNNTTQNILKEFFEMYFVEFYDKYKSAKEIKPLTSESFVTKLKKKRYREEAELTTAQTFRVSLADLDIEPAPHFGSAG